MARSSKKQTFVQKNRKLLATSGLLLTTAIVVLLAVYAFKGDSSSNGASTHSVSIHNLVMSTGVDATAKAQNVTSTFSQSDKHIYMVATLHNVGTSDKITYVRYYNGTYVDSAQASPSTNSSTHFFFDWSKNQRGSYPKGTYLIKVYVNGTIENAVAYSIQ